MRYLAGIAILAAACGNDNVHHLADSGTDAPATVDAAPDAPPEGLVTLTITADGARNGVTVHFQNADGSLVSTAVSDINGVASATMRAGGFVTAVAPFNGGELFTFAGVKPGDQLVLAIPDPPASVDITVDAPLDPGASHEFLFTTCGQAEITGGAGSGTGPAPVTLQGCPATIDMLVESLDVNFQPLQALFQPDVAVSEGAAVTLTNSYQPLVTTTVSLANFPAASTDAFVAQGLAGAHGIVFPTFQTFVDVSLASGAGTGSLSVPDVQGGFGVETIDVPGGVGERHAVVWGPYAGTFAFDGSDLLVPYTASPQWDPAANAVAYTVGAGTAPDFELTSIIVTDGTDGTTWQWHLVAPHATSLVYPHIPVSGGTDFNPGAGDAVGVSDLTAAKVPGGYDAVRALAFDIPVGIASVSATAGQVVFEDLPRPELTARPARAPHVFAPATRSHPLLAR